MSSLLFRLTVPSLMAVFVLWVGFSGYWADRYATDLRNSFEENGKRATQLFSGAVADALWEFDRRSAESTLAGLADWPNFAAVTVLDPSGEFTAFHNGERPIPGFPSDIANTTAGGPVRLGDFAFFSAQVTHPGHGDLGQLIAVFDERPLRNAIWNARRNAAISTALGFVLLGALLTRIARSVTRPIGRITDALEQVAAGNLDHPVSGVGTSDEVGRLADALEVFRKKSGRLVEVRSEAEANRRIARLAMIDDLTQLANRRAMVERFAQIEAARELKNFVTYSIAHIDLDGFKQINDSFGHSVGDLIITEVAKRLLAVSQSCDLIARIGGDEFVLLIVESTPGNAPQIIAESIVADLQRPFVHDGQELRIGASVGIASCTREGETLSDTLVNADVALYRAKEMGKGQVVTFNENHRQEIIARRRAFDEINHGIENGHFVPYFQGIFEAGTHRLVSVEMLARWQHPTKGILAPAHFLDLSNDLNLMTDIDKQVFKAAIDMFGKWCADGYNLPRLSINLSAARLIETDFLDMLSEARSVGLSVEVELLETILLDAPSEQLLDQIRRIRELGVGLSIDDFGTGHASIAGLIEIEPDKVKIDGRFVAPLLENDQSRNLVQILQKICDLLDIESVAECVETDEHARVLHAIGCDYLQGYALMKPISGEELRQELLQQSNAVGF